MTVDRIIYVEPPRAELPTYNAEEFGERVDLYEPVHRGRMVSRDDRRRRPSVMEFERFTRDVLERLQSIDYDPERDAVVLTGSQMMLALTLAALAVAHRRFMVLAFNSSVELYQLKEYDASWAAQSGSTSRVA